jgi:hypothetical protein
VSSSWGLDGQLDRRTQNELSDGTPFTHRGFATVPALASVVDLLDAILAAWGRVSSSSGTIRATASRKQKGD